MKQLHYNDFKMIKHTHTDAPMVNYKAHTRRDTHEIMMQLLTEVYNDITIVYRLSLK